MADMDVTAKFTADITDMRSKMETIARGMDTIRRRTDTAGKGFTLLRGTFATAFGTALTAGVGMAVGAIGNFARGTVSAAMEAEKANQRLLQIASSMGVLDTVLGGGIQRLDQTATELQKITGVSDETIKQAQALILTFKDVASSAGEQGGIFDRTTEAALDLSAAGFGGVEQSAKSLARALQDPKKGLTMLGRQGVTFTEQEKELITTLVESGKTLQAQEIILKAVETQVGGTAAATATGIDKMRAAFDELQEGVGAAIAPVMNTLATALIPLIESLEEPLQTIAQTVGGVLTQAFNAIAPLIGPLATTFAQIAATVGGALAQALSIITPALMPILDTFKTLAGLVGPLLSKVLTKVAQVLVTVLSVLTPLLDPLIELVFGILDAAWPIIEVVADAFMSIVQALGPVLKSVVVLLKPLGELIQVLLRAFMPVIKPLLPVISALANVLGVVLMKAVGLLMTGMGGLIVAFSKIAPFVLRNVTKPVVTHFLTMAKGVVGAAANMLGWVPGLGDSLKQAEAAIGKFAIQTESSIGKAADTIAAEGGRIGNEMITQGQAALNAAGPALGNAAAAVGSQVGRRYSDALNTYMTTPGYKPPAIQPPPDPAPTPSGTGSSSDKAKKQEEARKKQIQAFIDAYKKALEQMKEGRDTLMASVKKSPFAEMLGDLEPSAIQETFGKGGAISSVISSYDELSGAIDNFYGPLQNVKRFGKEAASAAKQNMREAQTMLRAATATALSLMKQRELNRAALDKLESDYSSAVDGINRSYDELDKAAAANLRSIEDRWAATIPVLENALERATSAYERENDVLKGLISERDSFLGRISDGFRSFVNDLKIDFEGADGGGAAIEKALNDRLQKVRDFSTNIRTLMQKGVDPSLVREFVSAGVSGAGDFVAQLAAASAEEIAGINAAQTALANEVASFQTYAAQQWFNAGIAQQEAIVAPLAAARDQAQAALLAANAARTAEIAAAQAHSETLRVQRQAALDAAKAQYDAQKAALIQQGVEIDTALTNNANNLHAGIANLQNTVPPEMFKAGKKSVNRMLDGFEKKFPGMKAELNRMMDDLAASMNRTATVTITTVHRSVFESVGPEHRALGGPIRAGQAYIVGERGPELFVSNAAGNIIPNNDLGSLMRRPMRDGMGGGQSVNIAPGAVQINVNGSMDARSKQEIEAVVDEALLRLAREIRRT